MNDKEKEFYLNQFEWLQNIVDKYNDTAKYFVDCGYRTGYNKGYNDSYEETTKNLPRIAYLKGLAMGIFLMIPFAIICNLI